MPASNLPVTTITRAGITEVAPTAADATNGNALATNNGRTTWVEATNTVTSPATVMVATPGTVDGNAIGDKSYSLPGTIGAKLRMGPFPIEVYGPNPVVTASAATVNLAAFQI